MASRSESEAGTLLRVRSRCRCGHLPTHHMRVVAVGESANFRLDPSGPCAICGEAVCRKFTPGGA